MVIRSIRAKMTAIFALSIAVLMLLTCESLIHVARRSENRRANALLSTTARKILLDINDSESTGNLADAQDDERQDLQAAGMAMLIIDAQGRISSRSQKTLFAWPRKKDDGWRTLSVRHGRDTIVLGLPWHKTENTLSSQARTLLFVSLLVILAAAVGAWVLVGWTLSPVGALSQQAQAASTERLGIQLTPPSQDREMTTLVTTLNGLLARLSETAQAKGRFYAAASHELRTPLQALSGHLDVALSRERTPEEYKATLEEAAVQTRTLIALTQDLLLLNQLEISSPQSVMRESVDLTEVCVRMLQRFRPLITQKCLRVQTNLEERVEVLAPAMHGEMLIRNLTENAVKYTPPGHSLRLTLKSSHQVAHLELFNECAPLPQHQIEKLFEPFFRPDASRNSATGGNGLGLAICRAITITDGWDLSLSQEGTGICVRVLFPTGLA